MTTNDGNEKLKIDWTDPKNWVGYIATSFEEYQKAWEELHDETKTERDSFKAEVKKLKVELNAIQVIADDGLENLKKLRAENAELRRALIDIHNEMPKDEPGGLSKLRVAWRMGLIAEQALNRTKETTNE